MTRECRAAAAGEQRKSVSQAIEDLLHTEDSGSDGRELKRQWQSVEAEQQLLVLQVGEQDLQRLQSGLVSQVQGCEHGVGHQGSIANLGELDQPGAVRESTSELGPNP